MIFDIVDVVPGSGVGGPPYDVVGARQPFPVSNVVGPGPYAYGIPMAQQAPEVEELFEASYGYDPGEVIAPAPMVDQVPGTVPSWWIPGGDPGEVVGLVANGTPPLWLRRDPYRLGAHLKSPRFGRLYCHHGIYIGNGQVIHFTSDRSKDTASARVRVSTLAEFADGHEILVEQYEGPTLLPWDIVDNAWRVVGATGYGLLSKNCEHIARWCVTGRLESRQVQRGVVGIGALIAVGLLIAL
jgi:hypothetical protein